MINFPALLNRAMDRLTEMGHAELIQRRYLRHADNFKGLHSCLREHIFFTDAKTDVFLQQRRQDLLIAS